jgi:hypothetical protein
MDDTTETPTTDVQPDQVPPPTTIDSIARLTDGQRAFVAPYLDEGWKWHGFRRILVMTALTDNLVVELGNEAAALDVELREKRQGKNARQAALQREKKEREGVISDRSRRLLDGRDELGRPMSEADKAEYSRHIAALRAEYDRFETDRKDELKALREELAELESKQAAIGAKIRDGRGNAQVSVVDLIDYSAGEVLSLRLDRFTEHSRRGLEDHERQLALFSENVPHPALSEDEYKLAIYGRISDAARGYVARTGLEVTEAQARKIVRQMLPDEEIPLEDIEIQDDAPPSADEPHDFAGEGTDCDVCGQHRLYELHPDTTADHVANEVEQGEAPVDDGRRFNVVFVEVKKRSEIAAAKLVMDLYLATDLQAAKALLREGQVLASGKTLEIANGIAKQFESIGALVSVDEAVLEDDGVLLDSTARRVGKDAAAGE